MTMIPIRPRALLPASLERRQGACFFDSGAMDHASRAIWPLDRGDCRATGARVASGLPRAARTGPRRGASLAKRNQAGKSRCFKAMPRSSHDLPEPGDGPCRFGQTKPRARSPHGAQRNAGKRPGRLHLRPRISLARHPGYRAECASGILAKRNQAPQRICQHEATEHENNDISIAYNTFCRSAAHEPLSGRRAGGSW